MGNKEEGELLVARARAFAEQAHGSIDHRRKYTGEPYAVHLGTVAELVTEVSGTSEMIAAAWLHDVVEDTPVTSAQIYEEFGAEVSSLVDQLTDVSTLDDGKRSIRKALDRAHLASASPEAKTVKLADLIDNSVSIIENDQRFAATYMCEKKLLLEILQEGDARLFQRATEITEQYFESENLK